MKLVLSRFSCSAIAHPKGNYQGIDRLWLRWYDVNGNWIPTSAEQERQRAERLAAKLPELGINPDQL
ncbi:hypothetical protein CI593_02295 [Fischerella thermalis CCMEE 5194]|nr:hypothetical protein CI593_02295 [Fischerella thermalis CCMEE 5194]